MISILEPLNDRFAVIFFGVPIASATTPQEAVAYRAWCVMSHPHVFAQHGCIPTIYETNPVHRKVLGAITKNAQILEDCTCCHARQNKRST